MAPSLWLIQSRDKSLQIFTTSADGSLFLFFIKYGACQCSRDHRDTYMYLSAHDQRCWYVISETLLNLFNTKPSVLQLFLRWDV